MRSGTRSGDVLELEVLVDADAAALTMAESYDEWYRVAATNASRPVHERRGFILPYLPDKADEMGLAVPMMPPELV